MIGPGAYSFSKYNIFRCSKNSQSQPRGQLKSLRTIAPDPRRWSGCQGPAADAHRAGGAGCEDSALTRRAGGPRAQGYERVVRQYRPRASCAHTAATVPWVPCDSTACERNRALPPRPPSFASHVFCREEAMLSGLRLSPSISRSFRTICAHKLLDAVS